MRYIADDISASNTVEEMNERHNSNQGSLFDFRKKQANFGSPADPMSTS